MFVEFVRSTIVVFTMSYKYNPALVFSIQMLVLQPKSIILHESIEIANKNICNS